MKRCFAFLLAVCLFIPCQVLAVSGQSYEGFLESYEENIEFLNQNTGRHLLPLVFARNGGAPDGGHRLYEIYGDVLSASVTLDAQNDFIETCQITLTAPADMPYGSSVHNDFETSGYHSYAQIMAMSADKTPADRYQLVVKVSDGLAASENGTFMMQVGVYRLTATRENNSAIFLFENPDAVQRAIREQEAAEQAAEEEKKRTEVESDEEEPSETDVPEKTSAPEEDEDSEAG